MSEPSKVAPATPDRGSLYRTVRGALLVIHLFPAVMNATAGLAFTLIASGGGAPGRAIVVAASVFLVSAAVGSMNDVLDVDLDTRTKPSKPIVRGDFSREASLILSLTAALLGVLLSFALGFDVMLVAVLVLASGLTYDFWLKETIWSWIPYGIGIPALPVWGFVAADAFTPILLASFPLGALVALALYLANTIPDIHGDTEYGIEGLAHRLGLARSQAVTWLCFAAAIVLLALTPDLLGNEWTMLMPGLIVGAVLLVAMIADAMISRSQGSLHRGWYTSAVLAVVLGVSWVISLPVV
ncbi:MAG: UbiA family prenyltransferase [Hyphomicrobiales bacterium]|nr:UbiA family prenyltransferase [Hyphomicrobiales bacterium]